MTDPSMRAVGTRRLAQSYRAAATTGRDGAMRARRRTAAQYLWGLCSGTLVLYSAASSREVLMFRRVALCLCLTPVVAQVLSVFLTATPVAAKAARSATVIDLGAAPAGQIGRATAANNQGEVVGLLSADGGPAPEIHAGAWARGAWLNLGGGEALAINNHGEVAGFASEGTQQQATVWTRSGEARALPNLPSGAVSQATAINDRGVAAGYAQSGNTTHAVVWEKSRTARDLNPANATTSYAYGIDDAGQVVGAANGEAVLWDRAGIARTLGSGPGSIARAINEHGRVVGQAGARAFSWSAADGVQWLPTQSGVSGSVALAISQGGDIVGNALFGDGFHAVSWHAGTMCDLNTLLPAGSGWQLKSAVAINGSTEIAGNGIHNGDQRAYLMKVDKAELAACTGHE